MFEGILKSQQARGQETSSLEKNIRDGKKEIAVMEKAVQLVGYGEV